MQISLREVMFHAVGPLFLSMKEGSVNGIGQRAREGRTWRIPIIVSNSRLSSLNSKDCSRQKTQILSVLIPLIIM